MLTVVQKFDFFVSLILRVVSTKRGYCLHVIVRAVLYADFARTPDPDPRYWPTLILAETPMPTGN